MKTILVRLWLILTSVATAAMLTGCGGGSHSGGGGGGTANNVQAIAVNGGPVAGRLYPNGAFTSVTVCVPSSSTCQTVDGILVDTGSFGLRILGSALTSVSLPHVTSGSNGVFNCVSFVDGSFLWGPVAQADVKMAGEVANKISVHIVEDPTGFSVPTACSNGGTDADNQTALGANGILGIGMEMQDCGPACVSGNTPPAVYFTCSSTGNCQTAFLPLAQQISNPVVAFAQDNNGVLLQLPAVNGAAATLNGSMIFGIGTQSNNALGSATVFTVDSFDNFTTKFNQQSLTQSFIDSGSNGFFFPDSAIPACPTGANAIAAGFFCPTSTENLSAQNVGANNGQNTVNFSVANAVSVFQADSTDSAFSQIAGPSFPTGCSGPCGFDWGLPLFYGRNVFTSIRGQTMPSGAPAAPWWAY